MDRRANKCLIRPPNQRIVSRATESRRNRTNVTGRSPSGLDPGVRMGPGVYVSHDVKFPPGSVIGMGANIGEGVVVESAIKIGMGAYIGEGAHLLRDCMIGEGANIGAGAKIGADATIDMGAFVGERAKIGTGGHNREGSQHRRGCGSVSRQPCADRRHHIGQHDLVSPSSGNGIGVIVSEEEH